MNCDKTKDQLISYLLDALHKEEKKVLGTHIDLCPDCKKALDNLKQERNMLKQWEPVIPPYDSNHIRQDIMSTVRAQKSIEEKSSKAILQTIDGRKINIHTEKQSIGLVSLWKTLINNKVVASAAAAAIIVFLVLGIDFVSKQNKAGVAWASIVKKIEMIDSYRSQIRIKIIPDHRAIIKHTVEVYHSSKYGNVIDQNWDMFDLNVKLYISFLDKTVALVHPQIKKYGRIVLREEEVAAIRKFDDPINYIREIMSYHYKKLGSKVIDGKRVEGIEVNDPRFEKGKVESCVRRLWADVETNLPVLYEEKAIAGDGKTKIELVQHSFEWNIGHDEKIFIPDFSEYTFTAEVVSQPANEETAVQMLRIFSEMTDGKYPYSLALFNCRRELQTIYSETMRKETGFQSAFFWEADDFEWEPYMRIHMLLGQTCLFYGNLVKENKDVAYYGKLITTRDVETPLMRWKISDDEYRVLFGDLRIEDVSEALLAELEADLDKSQLLNQPAPEF